MERAWPWLSERLEGMLDYNLRMVESGPVVSFPLPSGVIDKVRRVGARQIVLGTWISPI